ncbi:hypothetical protein B0T10DRAFT_210010 [Thelonectria olida]|uniref:Uncharacterized protein n=1 Tax=Thelonectria olida TaxID=1576542 RepID=A0A9P9AQJ6_9HYPO|nr:hypothetical protein B0T10DRAFT_210010 [Thelonectria olida]
MFGLDQIDWQGLRSWAEILPVGLLWGAGLALCSPTHPTVEIVSVWIFLVFGSVTALCFKPVLKAVKFHHIALLLALFYITHGIISYMELQNLQDGKSLLCEITSRLREFAVMAACVSTVLVIFHPVPVREPQQDPEKLDPLAPDFPAPVRCLMDSGPKDHCDPDVLSYSRKQESISDVDPVAFQHTGPGSAYPGSNHSSDICLSSSGNVNQILAQKLITWSKTVNPMELARDEVASTKPEPESH